MTDAEYQRIPEEQYQKLKFLLRGQFISILNVFKCYGMENDVIQAIEECVKVAENFAMAVRGKKKDIRIYTEAKRRPTD